MKRIILALALLGSGASHAIGGDDSAEGAQQPPVAITPSRHLDLAWPTTDTGTIMGPLQPIGGPFSRECPEGNCLVTGNYAAPSGAFGGQSPDSF